MKRLFAWAALLLLLPCAGLAETNGEVERSYFATMAPESTPEPAATPPAALETMPPEQTAYPCTAVANAARGGTVPLYARADAKSEVLMNYYRGTRITVLREAMPGFLLVQTGAQGAGLMGYMRKGDLAFGSRALREIQPEFIMIRLNRETPIYAYCDALSGVIGTCATEERYYTIGKNEGKWVQLYAPVAAYIENAEDELWWQVHAGESAKAGFVQLSTGLARGYESEAIRWEVEPIPGEITRAQAVELAIWTILNAEGAAAEHWLGEGKEGFPAELRSEEGLRALPFETIWEYSPPDQGFVEVSVEATYECDAYTVSVGLYPDGEIRYGRYEEAAEGS